ncbi:hypothetical protein AALB16_07915 [Lachnospiraceae bacterium 62-35]
MKAAGSMKKSDMITIWENIYLCVWSLYFIWSFLNTTLFHLSYPWYFEKALRVFIAIAVILKVGYTNKHSSKELLLCVGIGACFALSWISTGYVFLLDTAILLLAALQIPYKKILKVYFGCGLIVLGLAILGALTGCIDDLLYFDSERYKHAFGIVYTTDFAAHVVYLTLAFWIIYETIPASITFSITILLSAIIYHYCGAKCSTIVLLLTGIGILYVSAAKWLENKNAFGQRVIRCLDYILMIFMPLCAAVMIGLTMCYNPDNAAWAKIDVLLSGRLRLAKEAFDVYGIKLFGTAFDMIGGGGNNVRRLAYNFVDSSYCMILVRYGLVLLLCVLFLYIWTAKKAIKNKRRNLLVALAVIAVHNMIEHHLLELAYNVFILLAFADLCNKEEREEEKEGIRIRCLRKEKLAIYGLAAGGLLLLFPMGMDYGRTIVTLLSLNEPNRNIIFIAAVFLTAVMIAVFIKTVSDVLVRVIHKISPDRKTYLPLFISGTILCTVFILTNYVISSRAERYNEDLKRGSQLIADLREKGAEVQNIYIDDVPVLYKKKIANLSKRVLPPKSACKEQDVLIITDKNKEYHMLMHAGYMFGELSDRQGIYTNSESAAKFIKENGISLQKCYSVKRDVSLLALAEANGLVLTENGRMLVEGEAKSLIHGPWITVYGGKLQVEYRLRLKSSSVQDDVLAMARISSESGKNIYKEQELLRTDFNEDGYCSFVIESDIYSSEGMEFLLFARGDTILEIEGITYGKVENN